MFGSTYPTFHASDIVSDRIRDPDFAAYVRWEYLPALLASSEVLVRLAGLLEREDAVYDRLEAAHEDELHDLLELPLVRHRGPEDGELAPKQVAGVELEHRATGGARDDDPASFRQ